MLFHSRRFSTAIKKIGIVGAGQMGTGIGIVSSRTAGLHVTFVDPNEASLKSSQALLQKWSEKEIGKGRMSEQDKVDFLGRITYSDKVSHLTDVDMVVEAVSEDFKLKQTLFEQLAGVTPEHAILATNTSSISITKIAGCIPHRAH
jgi:3-hydroxybutyryl-CoA dehydrogenase